MNQVLLRGVHAASHLFYTQTDFSAVLHGQQHYVAAAMLMSDSKVTVCSRADGIRAVCMAVDTQQLHDCQHLLRTLQVNARIPSLAFLQLFAHRWMLVHF